ncbi:MAG: hypothetical protein OHK0013_25320 [Sandaracinaceae bacterium]
MDSRSPHRFLAKSVGIVVASVALALSGYGCLERGLKPVNPCTRSTVGQRIQVTNVDNVDLLFMVDNSNSMFEEQANLIEELPRLVQVLASGDRDEDGTRDFNPVRSLHVGVISSDLGAGPHTGVPTCDVGLGDDGILLSRSRTTTPPCMGSYPSAIFEFNRDTDDPLTFATAVGCVANLGTGGCGFEQQLEVSLKALTPISAQPWTRPGYTPPRFVSADGVVDSVGGNADGPNAGFLRPNSALAIVLVTDEEDCSVRDFGLFAPGDPRFVSVPLNIRCNAFGDPAMNLVFPVQRYVDGFLGLRRDPNLLIFSAITGIPPETEPEPGETPDFARILANPNMIPRPNAMGTNLEPSCSTRNGLAYPPIRIVQTAAGLSAAGASVSLSSICSDDFGPAIDGIIAKIADALRGACLPRALNPAADGRVDCEVFELLPEAGQPGVISDCTALPGREFVEMVRNEGEGPRQLCRVSQVARANIGSQAGWYYDDFSPDLSTTCGSTPQRIAFTSMAPPATGSEVRLECLQTIAIGNGGSDLICNATGEQPNDTTPSRQCRIGMFCDLAAAPDTCSTGWSLPNNQGANLRCDPVDRLCAVPCTDDSVCANAGLLGYVCDLRTNAEAAGDGVNDVPEALRGQPRGMCVNPTCN